MPPTEKLSFNPSSLFTLPIKGKDIIGSPSKSGNSTETSTATGSEVAAETNLKRPPAEEDGPGLLVTKDLQNVIDECRSRVETIARECRANNTKYRDIEFDLLNETYKCLYNIDWHGLTKWPSDTMRVTEVFESPNFFKADGAPTSDDIVQGSLGDCWFLCALATISNLPRVVRQICVARDEEVGVYGFIFYRDNGWVSVVVDDLLCTNAPKWEELTVQEKELYSDKDQFNSLTRRGGKMLTFAKSGAQGETWVPLIEKAYAKFYGNYNHLQGGFPREAIEDLTGGVATLIMTTDILDRDLFWREQLLKANSDRVFSCYFSGLNSREPDVEDDPNATVQGLYGNHAYSVLRAVECNGKQFVIVRNPWGESEWTGRWSDGSKEWKGEWLKILPLLGHSFGDDGQFVMEYSDFLECFTHIDRTLLFDSSWTANSKWLQVPIATGPIPWSYGDISFVVTIPSTTPAVIVLSQLNSRFFRNLDDGRTLYSLDFSIVREGERIPFARSTQAKPFCRRVTLEIDLPPGRYYVYVRIDRAEFVFTRDSDKESIYSNSIMRDLFLFDTRQLSKALSDKIETQKVASNIPKSRHSKFEPVTLGQVIQKEKSRSLLSRLWTSRTKRDVDPKDFYEGLLGKDEIVLGLNVYTKVGSPAKVMGRLKDGVEQ